MPLATLPLLSSRRKISICRKPRVLVGTAVGTIIYFAFFVRSYVMETDETSERHRSPTRTLPRPNRTLHRFRARRRCVHVVRHPV